MDIAPECPACAAIQLSRTLALRTPDWRTHVGPLLGQVADALTTATNPGQVLTALYDGARDRLRDGDPYQPVKDQANAQAEAWWQTHALAVNDLPGRLALAVAGNALDAGMDTNPNATWALFEQALQEPPRRDDRPQFLNWWAAQKNPRVVYLLDNCGEAVFDRELIRALALTGADVTAVVKGGPILNDITLREAEQIGLRDVCPVVDNGTDCCGILPGRVASHLDALLANADLIIAKGIGHLETLSHRLREQSMLFLYRAKCPPSARLVRVPEQTGVIWWRAKASLPPSA